MAIPTTQKECTTRRIAALIIGLWDKIKNAFLLKASRGSANGVASLDANGKVPTSQLPTVPTATQANYLTGFIARAGSIDWGTLTTSNGYKFVTDLQYAESNQDSGDIAFGYKAGSGSAYELSCQIDGYFYQRTGQERVLDTSDIGNSANHVATGDHTHGTLSNDFTVVMPNQDSDVGWQNNIGLSHNGFWLRSIRTQAKAPYWTLGNFSSAIAFGGGDTKGVISLTYDASWRRVRFAGGASVPLWWAGFKFGSSKEYEIGTGTYIPSCPDKSKGSSSVPVYIDSNGIIQACSSIPVIEHVTSIPVDPTVGTIYAL